MDGAPHSLEYTNLRCMDPARIHIEKLHIK